MINCSDHYYVDPTMGHYIFEIALGYLAWDRGGSAL